MTWIKTEEHPTRRAYGNTEKAKKKEETRSQALKDLSVGQINALAN